MYLLKRDELKELLEKYGQISVSIYMPTHSSTQQVRQDSIRLKNLLKTAEEHLKASGIENTKIQEILFPAQNLLNNEDFWNNGNSGLAIFLGENYSKILQLPQEFDEVVTVNNHFSIKQLLPFFTNDKRFHVLALSQNRIRLLTCTRFNCSEVELESMPQNMKDALWFISIEKPQDIPFKGTGKKGKGNVSIASGGKGGNDGNEIENERIFQFFREVDKGLSKYLHDDVAPLIIATADGQFQIFQNANTYPHLLPEFIKGNPERLSNDKLHEKGLKIAEKYFEKKKEEAINKYMTLYGTDNTVHNIKDALTSAYEGRIDTLIVAREREKWGKFDNDTTAIEEHKKQKPGDDDLIDLAAYHTIKNDGKVHVLDAEKMPKHMEVAGILRF